MQKKQNESFLRKHKTLIRVSYGVFLFFFSVLSLGALVVIETKESAFELALLNNVAEDMSPQRSFPLGVDPSKQTISENPTVDAFFETHLGGALKSDSKISWFKRNITAKLVKLDWYQNLASPVSRILVVQPGERREEVVDNFGDILRWDAFERDVFTSLVAGSSPELTEGKFFPGRYLVDKDASPETVAEKVNEKFNEQILSRYTEEIENTVPLQDAMTIASLLQREAYDFSDMRYISGIIWNRLFINMNLQLDASLQYAKANAGGKSWWPVPRPADKNIKSAFNTYKNAGLPPSPIANPSSEAILAALNPKQTECLFYFHDKKGGFHCTKTYEEHVALLKEFYGRGK